MNCSEQQPRMPFEGFETVLRDASGKVILQALKAGSAWICRLFISRPHEVVVSICLTRKEAREIGMALLQISEE
jgi:hypothetical protein